jgi:hyperpolarization activated cyclic nucleotide-gated potassium channel 1
MAPFNLAFAEELDEIGWYVKLSYTIDIIFFLDIIINFNLAFQDEAYKTIDDRKVIACEYLKGWFMIDLLSIIPFELILMLL